MHNMTDANAVALYDTSNKQSFNDKDHSTRVAETNRVDPPHFMNETFSGAQPARSGAYNEAERVRNSFRTGSCWSLKKLPSRIQPGEVTKLRKVQTYQNILSRPDHVNFASQAAPLSTRAVKYIGTPFDKPDALRKMQVDEEKYSSERFSRRVFTVPAQMSTHKGLNFVSPDFGPGAAVAADCLARKPVDSKFLHGPFYQNVPPIAKEIPRSNAKSWVKSMYAQLAEDWAGLVFSIKLTAQEIVIKFPTQSQQLPAESALTKYMLRQATHGNPQKWGLRKRGDRWCVLEIQQADSNDNGSGSASTVLAEHSAPGEPMLTFSFYLPWESGGLLKVAKQTGQAARDKISMSRSRETARETAIENAFNLEQSNMPSTVGRHTQRSSAVSVSAFLQQRSKDSLGTGAVNINTIKE